jgi:hypothetical protein
MRAYIVIAAITALAMFAVAQGKEDRIIGAANCSVDCPEHDADVDNGLGLSSPVDTTKYDDDYD